MDLKLGLMKKQYTTKINVLKCGATERNCCKGNNYDKQPENQIYILSGPDNEKQIRALRYSLRTIEGRLEGKRGRGRPRRTWIDD